MLRRSLSPSSGVLQAQVQTPERCRSLLRLHMDSFYACFTLRGSRKLSRAEEKAAKELGARSPKFACPSSSYLPPASSRSLRDIFVVGCTHARRSSAHSKQGPRSSHATRPSRNADLPPRVRPSATLVELATSNHGSKLLGQLCCMLPKLTLPCSSRDGPPSRCALLAVEAGHSRADTSSLRRQCPTCCLRHTSPATYSGVRFAGTSVGAAAR